MKKAILATKVGMTQIFAEDGSLIPVTVLQAGPCVVTQIKTIENDGYEAVQVGFVDKKDKIINKDASGKKEIVHAHGTTPHLLLMRCTAYRAECARCMLVLRGSIRVRFLMSIRLR